MQAFIAVPLICRLRLRLFALALMLGVATSMSGCSSVKLVADYDAAAAKRITDTSGEALGFYDTMINDTAGKKSAVLPYEKYRDGWSKLETQLRVIVVQEEARPLNESSIRIAHSILDFAERYRAMHQKEGNYVRNKGDAPLAVLKAHRDKMQRLFIAALAAEKAKLLAKGDTDPTAKEDD